MKNLSRITGGVLSVLFLVTPVAFVEAASLSIISLSPGSTVTAKDGLSFKISPSGFEALSYQLTDSFPGSSVSQSNIAGAGNFYWVPSASDVGSHVLTITASNSSGDTAYITQSITVAPAASLSISSLSPGAAIMPGTRLSFTVSASGLTNPSYSVGDSFGGSSVANVVIGASGNFSWTPDLGQSGDHVITVYARDASGHSASITQTVRVGIGPSLTIALLSPGASVALGTTTTFTVIPTNYAPTAYSVSDNFTGSSVSNSNITTSGLFSWFPQGSDAGVHVLTIKGTVGAFGDSTTTTQTITVVGAGGATQSTLAATSSAASGTSLSVLQAQLAALLAQTKAQSNTTSTASVAPAFTSNLHSGMQSDDVSRLQTLLLQQGFFSGTPSGYYGPQTTTAVKKFQKAHGLDQLGTVGPGTRAALNALSSGSQTAVSSTVSVATSDGYIFKNFMGLGEDSTDGPDVMELQKRLATLGFFSGVPTGTFGPATEASVKKFQKAHGLSAVGYVGSETRAALNK